MASSDRQVVDNTLDKSLGAIEVISGVIAAWINIKGKMAIIALLETHALSECISRRSREATGEPPVKFHLQGMVARRVSGK